MSIGIIIGSIRDGRKGEGVARWVHEQTRARDRRYELLDLRQFDVPLLTTSTVPGAANRRYDDERVTRWGQAIDACEGFIFVTPEYNHGVPGAFKNAFDSIYPEWQHKAVAFVSYGAASGFRAVEAWRPVIANANMHGIRAQVAFSTFTDFDGSELTPAERHAQEATDLFEQLETATTALASLRT